MPKENERREKYIATANGLSNGPSNEPHRLILQQRRHCNEEAHDCTSVSGHAATETCACCLRPFCAAGEQVIRNLFKLFLRYETS